MNPVELTKIIEDHKRWLASNGADGVRANLRSADLSYANLSYADLSYANLSSANLRSANLRSADLSYAKNDLFEVLTKAPGEVAGLRLALVEGRVDGSKYEGECACLKGTIANLRHVEYDEMPDLRPDSSSPSERWFMGIREGDTPETNQVSKITVEWIDEWITANQPAAEVK